MGAFSIRGNARGRYNRTLAAIIERAAAGSPYDVVMFSADRSGGRRSSQHHGNNAVDIVLVDPTTGQELPNYKTAETYPQYEAFARLARSAQQEIAPDRPFRWGGWFNQGGPDLMHFDFGGGNMALGSWEGGLNDTGRRVYAQQGRGFIKSHTQDAAAPRDERYANLFDGQVDSLRAYAGDAAQPAQEAAAALAGGELPSPAPLSDYEQAVATVAANRSAGGSQPRVTPLRATKTDNPGAGVMPSPAVPPIPRVNEARYPPLPRVKPPGGAPPPAPSVTTPQQRQPIGGDVTLHPGDREDDPNGPIHQLQTFLNTLGADMPVDGVYGRRTRNAVRAFQRAHKNENNDRLKVDGIVGHNTWAAINAYQDVGVGADIPVPRAKPQPEPDAPPQMFPDDAPAYEAEPGTVQVGEPAATRSIEPAAPQVRPPMRDPDSAGTPFDIGALNALSERMRQSIADGTFGMPQDEARRIRMARNGRVDVRRPPRPPSVAAPLQGEVLPNPDPGFSAAFPRVQANTGGDRKPPFENPKTPVELAGEGDNPIQAITRALDPMRSALGAETMYPQRVVPAINPAVLKKPETGPAGHTGEMIAPKATPFRPDFDSVAAPGSEMSPEQFRGGIEHQIQQSQEAIQRLKERQEDLRRQSEERVRGRQSAIPMDPAQQAIAALMGAGGSRPASGPQYAQNIVARTDIQPVADGPRPNLDPSLLAQDEPALPPVKPPIVTPATPPPPREDLIPGLTAPPLAPPPAPAGIPQVRPSLIDPNLAGVPAGRFAPSMAPPANPVLPGARVLSGYQGETAPLPRPRAPAPQARPSLVPGPVSAQNDFTPNSMLEGLAPRGPAGGASPPGGGGDIIRAILAMLTGGRRAA